MKNNIVNLSNILQTDSLNSKLFGQE